MTTASSTHSPPALRMSVCRLGHDASRRPLTTSASTRVHGAWQIAATGLPEADEVPDERHRVGVERAVRRGWRRRPAAPARRSRRRGLSYTAGRPDWVLRLVEVLEELGLTRLGREQHRLVARVLERLPRLDQLGLLDALVGGQERDLRCSSHAIETARRPRDSHRPYGVIGRCASWSARGRPGRQVEAPVACRVSRPAVDRAPPATRAGLASTPSRRCDDDADSWSTSVSGTGSRPS